MTSKKDDTSRRDFIKKSSTAAAATSLLAGLNAVQAAHTSYDETIRLGMIGCGGRCTGAAAQAMNTEGPTKLIAMCDAFEDRLQGSLKTLQRQHKDKVDVPAENQFVGFDGYKKLLATDIDVVLIATPPGFRPVHVEAAVKAGKHIFMVAWLNSGFSRSFPSLSVAMPRSREVNKLRHTFLKNKNKKY